ncbi:hypothetical protein A9R01_13475 ['Osedax' symbiont bacterium Rs2_46_30_T18]|nr:hypothetical protein A9R01_13475 ['Osedax' symbiont bacterium Rs2_46_30_T18]
MDTSDHYKMSTLFAQLGLPSEPEEVEKFIAQNRVTENQRLEQAGFWSREQSRFLTECIEEDSDWVELVDHLDSLLRH